MKTWQKNERKQKRGTQNDCDREKKQHLEKTDYGRGRILNYSILMKGVCISFSVALKLAKPEIDR
jgi:hypothetical protein